MNTEILAEFYDGIHRVKTLDDCYRFLAAEIAMCSIRDYVTWGSKIKKNDAEIAKLKAKMNVLGEDAGKVKEFARARVKVSVLRSENVGLRRDRKKISTFWAAEWPHLIGDTSPYRCAQIYAALMLPPSEYGLKKYVCVHGKKIRVKTVKSYIHCCVGTRTLTREGRKLIAEVMERSKKMEV